MSGATTAARALALGLGVLLALTGCGNHTEKTDAGVALRNLANVAQARRAAAAARNAPKKDAGQVAAEALAKIPGPIQMVTFPSGEIAAMGLYGENGALRTYATADRRTVSFRDGIVVSTRGFGDDLMSADTGAVAALIRAGRAGTAERVMRYLDGEGIERPLPLSCTVRPAGGAQGAMKMEETCRYGALTFTNSYMVQGGTILASTQWLGQSLGSVSTAKLR